MQILFCKERNIMIVIQTKLENRQLLKGLVRHVTSLVASKPQAQSPACRKHHAVDKNNVRVLSQTCTALSHMSNFTHDTHGY